MIPALPISLSCTEDPVSVQQQSMPFEIYTLNGTESSCWRSGSVYRAVASVRPSLNFGPEVH